MSHAVTRAVRDGARAYAADLDVSQQLMAVLERVHAHPQMFGWNCIEYVLPVTFPRAPDPALARLLVHAGLVSALQQKGFTVRVAGNETKPFLLVGWRSSVGRDDLRRLQKELAALRIDDAQVAAFRESGRQLAARPPAAGLSAVGTSANGGPPAAGLPAPRKHRHSH